MANDDAHAAFLKGAVLDHIRKNCGADIVETGCEDVAWIHEGCAFRARVGESLDFYGDVGQVWCILKRPNLWFVVTTYRGAVQDGPILIGLPASESAIAALNVPKRRR